MLGECRRRWSGIKPTLIQHLVFVENNIPLRGIIYTVAPQRVGIKANIYSTLGFSANGDRKKNVHQKE